MTFAKGDFVRFTDKAIKKYTSKKISKRSYKVL